MKKYLIEESEKNRILKMHELIKEQSQPLSQPTQSDLDKLKLALKTCIKKYTWFTPDTTSPIRKTKSGKDVIVGTGTNGNTYYFYTDLTVINVNTGVKKNWECDFTPTPVSKKEEPVKPTAPVKQLNANQNKVLELIKPQGWFSEPVPTDVEVEQGLFDKVDLTDIQNQTKIPKIDIYLKYFKDDYPNGFFVYRKIVSQKPEETKLSSKVEITTQSCKAAIETLYNNMKSPMTYPLSNEEKSNYRLTAKTCAEPANSSKFLLRFSLKNKVEELQNNRII